MTQPAKSSERLVRDGHVAVLYSPGFGAGWSTWNSEYAETLLFDPEIAEAVLANNRDEAAAIAERKCGGPESHVYVGGARDLKVCWLLPGTRFEIDEYDGSESVRVIDQIEFFVA